MKNSKQNILAKRTCNMHHYNITEICGPHDFDMENVDYLHNGGVKWYQMILARIIHKPESPHLILSFERQKVRLRKAIFEHLSV